MPAERIAMRQVRDVLRLNAASVSGNEIARRVGVAPSTVRLTLKRLAAAGPVAAIDAVLPSTFENGMLGDDIAEIENTDQIGKLLDLDNPAGPIRHTVIVTADRDEAIVADAAFQLEHGVETMLGRCLQLGLLGRERRGDDPLGGAVDADIRS